MQGTMLGVNVNYVNNEDDDLDVLFLVITRPRIKVSNGLFDVLINDDMSEETYCGQLGSDLHLKRARL